MADSIVEQFFGPTTPPPEPAPSQQPTIPSPPSDPLLRDLALNPTTGLGKHFDDPSIPLEKRVGSYLDHSLAAKRVPEQIDQAMKDRFGLGDQGRQKIADAYKQSMMARDAAESASKVPEGDFEQLIRHYIPGGSSLHNRFEEQQYQHAKARLEGRAGPAPSAEGRSMGGLIADAVKGNVMPAGNSASDDYDTVARYEQLQKLDENRSFGKKFLDDTVGGAIRMGGEAVIGGAVIPGGAATSLLGKGGHLAGKTALMPSLYVDSAERKMSQDPELSAGKAYGSEFLYGMAQNAILGKMSAKVGGGTGLIGKAARVPVATGAGMVEQAGLDIGASAIDDLARDTVNDGKDIFGKKYGLAGAFARNDPKKWEETALQASTFAMFSMLHAAHNDPTIKPDAMKKQGKAVQEAIADGAKQIADSGKTPEEASRDTAEVMNTVSEYMKQGLHPDHIRELVKGDENWTDEQKAMAGTILDQLPKPTTPEPAKMSEPTPEAPPEPPRINSEQLNDPKLSEDEQPTTQPIPETEKTPQMPPEASVPAKAPEAALPIDRPADAKPEAENPVPTPVPVVQPPKGGRVGTRVSETTPAVVDHHAANMKRHVEAMDAGVGRDKTDFRYDAREAFKDSFTTPEASRLHNENVKELHVLDNSAELTKKVRADNREASKTEGYNGAWNEDKGRLYIDGYETSLGGKSGFEAMQALNRHEVGHSVMGKELPEGWQEAFDKEHQQGQLTKQAAISPQEAFAETYRLMAEKKPSLEAMRKAGLGLSGAVMSKMKLHDPSWTGTDASLREAIAGEKVGRTFVDRVIDAVKVAVGKVGNALGFQSPLFTETKRLRDAGRVGGKRTPEQVLEAKRLREEAEAEGSRIAAIRRLQKKYEEEGMSKEDAETLAEAEMRKAGMRPESELGGDADLTETERAAIEGGGNPNEGRVALDEFHPDDRRRMQVENTKARSFYELEKTFGDKYTPEQIHKAWLESLPITEKQREALEMRLGGSGANRKPVTLEKIAEKLGVTKQAAGERIERVLGSAFTKAEFEMASKLPQAEKERFIKERLRPDKKGAELDAPLTEGKNGDWAQFRSAEKKGWESPLGEMRDFIRKRAAFNDMGKVETHGSGDPEATGKSRFAFGKQQAEGGEYDRFIKELGDFEKKLAATSDPAAQVKLLKQRLKFLDSYIRMESKDALLSAPAAQAAAVLEQARRLARAEGDGPRKAGVPETPLGAGSEGERPAGAGRPATGEGPDRGQGVGNDTGTAAGERPGSAGGDAGRLHGVTDPNVSGDQFAKAVLEDLMPDDYTRTGLYRAAASGNHVALLALADHLMEIGDPHGEHLVKALTELGGRVVFDHSPASSGQKPYSYGSSHFGTVHEGTIEKPHSDRTIIRWRHSELGTVTPEVHDLRTDRERRQQEEASEPDDGGHLHGVISPAPDKTLREKAAELIQKGRDTVRRLGQAVFPTASRMNAEVGDLMAKLAAAKDPRYAEELTSDFLRKAMPDATPIEMHQFKAVLSEWRQQRTRADFNDRYEEYKAKNGDALTRMQNSWAATKASPNDLAAHSEQLAAQKEFRDTLKVKLDAETKRNEVTTHIGQHPTLEFPNYPGAADGERPFASQREFEALRDSPRMRELMKKYEPISKALDQVFSDIKGYADPSEIEFNSQMPGLTFNEMNVDKATGMPSAKKSGSATGAVKSKKGPFDREYTASSAAAETDLRKVLEHSFQKSLEYRAHKYLMDGLERTGLGVYSRLGVRSDVDGQPGVELPAKYSTRGRNETQSMYVHGKIGPELKQLFGMNDKPDHALKPLMDAATGWQMLGFGDFIWHTRNLLTGNFSVGVKPVYDLIRTIAGAREGSKHFEDYRKQLTWLAENDALGKKQYDTTEKFQSTAEKLGLGKAAKLASAPNKVASAWMHKLDTVMRVMVADGFDRAVKSGLYKGTQSELANAKRNLVNGKFGNYDARSQSLLVKFCRDTGIGPFATAATTFYTNSIRGLVGGQGIKAATTLGGARIRAMHLAKIVGTLATAYIVNNALWGRPDGDDATPIGAIKTGNKNGKSLSFDLLGLTGYSRGLRSVGLKAMLEEGKLSPQSATKGANDALHSAMHSMTGPPVAFAYTALTGKNTLGVQVADQPSKAQTPTGKIAAAKKGLAEDSPFEQEWLNLKAALMGSNPALGTLSGYNKPAFVRKEEANRPTSESLPGLLGPFNPVQERSSPSPKGRVGAKR